MIEEALVAILEGQAGLVALVGDRIYNLVIPQNSEMPAIAFQLISSSRVRSHTGPSHFADPRFQISCYAGNGTVAKNVAAQVRLALECYTGTIAGETIYGAFVASIWSGYENETKLFRETIDVRIMYNE